MDNLTHTIVGLAVGELIHRSVAPAATPAQQSTRRRVALTACACASNFPDLDLLLVNGMPAPLGYLLEHRGHTHTFLLELPQALLLCALLWLLWPAARRLLAASGAARGVLAAAVIAGFILHIGMDAMNSYGVHPFYPFSGRWYYGDLVFIIEPVFWIGAGVPLIMTMERRWLRAAWLAMLAAVLGACVFKGFLHWGSWLGLTAIAALLILISRMTISTGQGRSPPLIAGLLTCMVFVAMQAFASGRAGTALRTELAGRSPGSTLIDAALTAYPANPLCWNAVAIERQPGSAVYQLRRSVLSLAPQWLPVDACPAGLTGQVAAPAGQAIATIGSELASVNALRQRAQSDCHMAAWLHFARMPQLEGDIASDARFGTTVAPNFSTIDLAQLKGRSCPPTPAWGMPRADLLGLGPP